MEDAFWDQFGQEIHVDAETVLLITVAFELIKGYNKRELKAEEAELYAQLHPFTTYFE